MSGFTKLFESILDSTIWRESKETRLVWVTMLAMADIDGIVDSSLPGLADRAKVSLSECQKAIMILTNPDEWSRSKEHEGRRIVEVDGGWQLLNHAKYRDKQSADEIKEKARLRQAAWRERHPDKKPKRKPRPKGNDRPNAFAEKVFGDTGIMHQPSETEDGPAFNPADERGSNPVGDPIGPGESDGGIQ